MSGFSNIRGNGIPRPPRTPSGKAQCPTVTRSTRDTLPLGTGEFKTGKDGLCRMLVRVKSSRKQLGQFLHWCETHHVKATPESADTTPTADGRNVLACRDWWIVTGFPHQFDTMEAELTGQRLPVLTIKPLDTTRVGVVAGGTGKIDANVRKKIRSFVPFKAPIESEGGKRFREWREQQAAAKQRANLRGTAAVEAEEADAMERASVPADPAAAGRDERAKQAMRAQWDREDAERIRETLARDDADQAAWLREMSEF